MNAGGNGLKSTSPLPSRSATRKRRVNSRAKGARAERQWRDELRANGYMARRGQQFAGSPDSPDVVCDELDWIHFEVKAVERLNIWDAMDQARRDAGKSELRDPKCEHLPVGHHPNLEIQKVPIVAHTRNFRPWLITITAETFFEFLRGTLPPERTGAARQEQNSNDNTQES